MHLNQEQRLAVMHHKGPCLLLAGPGSGKTFTLIRRIEYLTQSCGVAPGAVLMLTFSKASALEMKERCGTLMGERAKEIFFGTFHSFFFKLLRQYGEYTASDVVQQNDYLHFHERKRGEEAYQEWKESEGKLDYPDMEKECMKLLTKEKWILEEVQKRYTYIMVDEFQDISELQYRILRLLEGKEQNIFAVGDDDQSIYGFRGASPEIMLRLREDYPAIRILHLNMNYRCPEEIVRLSGRLIRHNARRYPKRLRSSAGKERAHKIFVTGTGEKVFAGAALTLEKYDHPAAECEGIVSEIQSLRKRGVPLREIAVIGRVREDLRRMRDICIEKQLPAAFADQAGSIYDHFIFRDLWSYIKAASGNRERKYFLRILNCPQRYLLTGCLEDEQVSFERMCSWYGFQKEPRDEIRKLKSELEIISEMSIYAALQYICRKTGYFAYLKCYAKERNISVKNLYMVLDEILERAKRYPDMESWERELRVENGRKMETEEATRNEVRLLTIHGSKGLEFPYVFIMGVNEGNIPNAGADTAEPLEEERRLLYVAVTRTKCHAFLSFTEERNGKAAKPSRFLSEMKLYSVSEYRDSK